MTTTDGNDNIDKLDNLDKLRAKKTQNEEYRKEILKLQNMCYSLKDHIKTEDV